MVCQLAHSSPLQVSNQGGRVEAINGKQLLKAIKMALRMKDKVSSGPKELLHWIKS